MAVRWIRELVTTATGSSTGIPFYVKCCYLFLKHVCGYTPVSTKVTIDGIGDSLGTPSGSNQVINDGAGYFTSDMVGQTITISGATNPTNNGAFTIVGYTNATQITFTNAAGVAETSSFSWSITPPTTADYDSYEATGTAGEWNLTNKDYVFRDIVYGAFSAGDVGKWIIVNSTDIKNAGIYEIDTFIDANRVTLNYRANTVNGERYPEAETGLTWYMLAADYEVPQHKTQYARLASPSTKGWEVEFGYHPVNNQMMQCRVCLDSNWSGSKILQTAYAGVANSASTYNYFVTDTDGSYLAFMMHNDTSALYNGLAVCEISPYDVGHTDEELVGLFGNKSTASSYPYNNSWNFNWHIYGLGHGYVWNDIKQSVDSIYVLDPTANGYAASLRRYGTREASRRLTGSQDITRDGDSISMAGSTATLTDAAATFVDQDVGRQIIIYNTTIDGNAGVFVITAVLGPTQVQYFNPLGSNETSLFGWTMPQKIDVFGGTMYIKDYDNTSNQYEIYGKTFGMHTGQYNVNFNTAVNVVNYADYMHFYDGAMFEFIGFVSEHV